jgi:hypothetical protein
MRVWAWMWDEAQKREQTVLRGRNLRSDTGVLLIGDRLRHLGGSPGVDLWVGGGMLRSSVLLVRVAEMFGQMSRPFVVRRSTCG